MAIGATRAYNARQARQADTDCTQTRDARRMRPCPILMDPRLWQRVTWLAAGAIGPAGQTQARSETVTYEILLAEGSAGVSRLRGEPDDLGLSLTHGGLDMQPYAQRSAIRYRRLGRMASVLLILMLAACSSSTPPQASDRSSPAAPPADAPGSPAAQSSAVLSPEPRARHMVKMGTVAPNISQSGIYIAMDRGHFREQGVEVEDVSFTRGLEMVPALSTNQIQVGMGSAGAGMFNAVSQGIYNRVVADAGSIQPDASLNVMMYRRDLYDSGALTRPEQLRGKRISISGPDAVQEFTVMGLLIPYLGLAPTDVTLVAIPIPDTPAALGNGTVDAAWTFEPFASTIETRDLGVRGITAGEFSPGTQATTILYAEEFTRNRDAANAWMVAYVRALRDYNDALFRNRNTDEILAILERRQAIQNRSAVDRMILGGLNPNGYVYQDNLAAMQDYFVRKGTVKQAVAISDLVDNSFVDHAIRVLGEYD
jgi:ABC-type nitrate/sulfonate/bicarbonate transport system substrate-binding protein